MEENLVFADHARRRLKADRLVHRLAERLGERARGAKERHPSAGDHPRQSRKASLHVPLGLFRRRGLALVKCRGGGPGLKAPAP